MQYANYLTKALRGDLGRSIRSNRPVASMIAEQLPSTLMLAAASMIVAIAIGVPLGSLAALQQNRWTDTLIMIGAISGVSIPSFFLALLLILLFSVSLGWRRHRFTNDCAAGPAGPDAGPGGSGHHPSGARQPAGGAHQPYLTAHKARTRRVLCTPSSNVLILR